MRNLAAKLPTGRLHPCERSVFTKGRIFMAEIHAPTCLAKSLKKKKRVAGVNNKFGVVGFPVGA
jgi:hypothetical protein